MVGCTLFKFCHFKCAKAYLLEILGMSRLWHDLMAHGFSAKQNSPCLLSCNRRKFVDSSCMACIQRARYMNLLYAFTTALKHDTHLATAYFSTKKRQPCNSTKRMGPKMHGKWNQIIIE